MGAATRASACPPTCCTWCTTTSGARSSREVHRRHTPLLILLLLIVYQLVDAPLHAAPGRRIIGREIHHSYSVFLVVHGHRIGIFGVARRRDSPVRGAGGRTTASTPTCGSSAGSSGPPTSGPSSTSTFKEAQCLFLSCAWTAQPGHCCAT
jgi:hypothetical protein